jgi:Domain of unknown function (DUF305)
MAKTEKSGQNKDAVALAERIIRDQTAEISKIQGMLKSWAFRALPGGRAVGARQAPPPARCFTRAGARHRT